MRRDERGSMNISRENAGHRLGKTDHGIHVKTDRNVLQNREKRLFLLILVLSFAAVLVLNLFTPMLSDDYSYAMEVQEASSFWDLIKQEYHQYLTWNGRSVAHLLLRIFLYLPAPVFKVANSLAFVGLSCTMVQLTAPQRKYDCYALLMVQLGLWLYAVDFSETILWEDGACNYLWGAWIILSFMLLEKKILGNDGRLSKAMDAAAAKKPEKQTVAGTGLAGFGKAVAVLLFGVLAGWCNENTSGGCLLFLLTLFIAAKRKGRRIPLPYYAGVAGNVIGLAILVLSPGGRVRASYNTDENYTGLLGLLARIQKITLTIRENFLILLAVLLICVIVLWFLQNQKGAVVTALYGGLFLATSYALVATRQTQPRAFFGAGLFLIIGIVYGLRQVMDTEGLGNDSDILKMACWSIMAVLLLQFVFAYADNATNVGRIWRDEKNRIAYIEEQAAAGATDVTIPMVHTDFYNDYSAIAKMEMTEDSGYWINIFYERYYGIDSIHAIPYEEWEQLGRSNSTE